jgi:hypothetical protein
MVIDEVDKDMNQNNGPNYFRVKLRSQGLVVARYGTNLDKLHCPFSQDWRHRRTVRNIMMEHFPTGFDKRFPGKQQQPITRHPLTAIGPFHEISSDGHEKLSQQALQMGDIGLPIYAYKDKWSDVLLKISVVPNCRSAGAIGHLFLDLIGEIGGMLLVTR